ncbi:DUF4112 domain-containing protein [Parasphingopyxis algicola]|uniref:DUF4112 domain-containing protein n=1 Tax=Parasphingopyxis algicola TaxID=2026624 RepID=UPI0015A18335|nr:DUF4112 domain-containing protein [Parasphingopyxis algicola]QLC24671.1 DUF4112 domain-containing protein [Parasphingopyxis algicola]
MALKQEHLDRIADAMPEIGRDPASVRQRVEAMEALLERGFTMPVINRPFGLDFILGLVPVVGDLIAAVMGTWLVWEARNLGMPKWKIARMFGNIGVDLVVGAVPLIGDAADFVFRSNTHNLRIIRKHLDKHHPETVTIEGQLNR